MNAEFLTVVDFWEREKGISRDVLLAAVQDALLSAAKNPPPLKTPRSLIQFLIPFGE